MKHILLLFLLPGLFLSCKTVQEFQESSEVVSPSILLIATAHDLRETPASAIEQVREEILAFAPDVFLVELPPPDDKYANEIVFNYSQNFDLFHHLLSKKNIQIRLADSVISEYQEKLQQDTDNPEILGHLLHAYLLEFDIGNALYQSYSLFHQEGARDAVKELLDSSLFSVDTLDQYQLIVTGEEKDEFSQIVFPTARLLGLTQIYGFDNRDDEYAYQQVLRKSDQELKEFVRERYGLQEEKDIRARMEELLGTSERRVQEQHQLFEFLNASLYDHYRKTEYMQRLALTPSESSRNYLSLWKLRNMKMSNNIVQVLKKTQASRAVVLVGAAHAWILRELLQEQGYEVLRPFSD